MRLIDADVIKIPKGFFEKVDNVPKFYDWLDDQPTVDPVKHGQWITDNKQTKCSICGRLIPLRKVRHNGVVIWEDNSPVNYCPNCGADMRGEQNGH